MSLPITATWHKASFEHFIKESLLHLLAERTSLTDYMLEESTPHTCRLTFSLLTGADAISVTYDNIPRPDEEGIFHLGGQPRVVIPVAEHEHLEKATIDCVGEQLYRYIDERLGALPREVELSEEIIRALMPLDNWIQRFFAERGQPLDQQNWLALHQHLRRIVIAERREVMTPGQFGRTCPFETPEGPNIGRYLHIALGATIKERKLVIVDERPEMALGLSAAMIPLLEHDDPAKLLMGTNMLRQWMVPAEPELALVQTGSEPQAQNFWCGRNLLTAFVSWGADTFEDAIVISESCARKLGYPTPVEPGDKLSNRHGMKGVVSRVLPDAEMPHLADGTPVELVFSFLRLHSRLYFGPLREAILGRIAHARNVPVVVPPFHAPDVETLHAQLQELGLPTDGMERLTIGRDGQPVSYPSTVGWVYWGRLYHTAASKVRVAVHEGPGQQQEQQAYTVLRYIGAYEAIHEHFNTCATGRPDAHTLADRVARGEVVQASTPTPQLANLARRLAAAGIRTELVDETLRWHFAPPQGPTLKLARPLPHPWLPERMLSEIGVCEHLPQYADLVEVNTRLERMLHSGVPESLTKQVQAQLETRLRELFAVLLTTQEMQFRSRVLFSARAVLAPASDVRLDQIGIGEQIAWQLFGPLVARELGSDGAEELRTHSQRATEVLDALMARSWVLVYRAPALTPTAFLAFHPVRYADNVIRLHPLTCTLLNADFDGDQVALFLPITEAGQQEAGERFSVIGHLRRDPVLLRELIPADEAMWGLAALSLTTEGRAELAELLGTTLPTGLLTRTALYDLIKRILCERGEQQTLAVLERLIERGFAVTQRSGASLSPFIGSTMQRPPAPVSEDIGQWTDYTEMIEERIAARTDFANADGGPQLLTAKSEAMGYTHFIHLLRSLIGPRGIVTDIQGVLVPIQHGFGQGLRPREMFALTAGSRMTLARLAQEWEQHGSAAGERTDLHGFNVLVRAMRSQSPGVVFAHAAATGEIDPLTDIDSRLFVGLAVV